MNSRSLLIEIGCEELPSSSLKKLGVAMGEVVSQKLDELKLEHGTVQWFAAPRRLAVHVAELQEQAADEEQEALGTASRQSAGRRGQLDQSRGRFCQATKPRTRCTGSHRYT